jgi:TPR repeat protein
VNSSPSRKDPGVLGFLSRLFQRSPAPHVGLSDQRGTVGPSNPPPAPEIQPTATQTAPETSQALRSAAEQGNADAQFQVGNLCHPAGRPHGSEDIGEARIEAYVWYHRAAAQGHTRAAASCEMLNLQMSDMELKEGNRRATRPGHD